MAQGAKSCFGRGCPSVTNSAKLGGSASPTFCPARQVIPVATPPTTACSSMACCGSCAAAHAGATCRRALVRPRACTSGFVAGRTKAGGRRCLCFVAQRPQQRLCPARRQPGQSPPTGRHRQKKGGDKNQALGRRRGGPTTKVHLLCDARGRPLRLLLDPWPSVRAQGARPRCSRVCKKPGVSSPTAPTMPTHGAPCWPPQAGKRSSRPSATARCPPPTTPPATGKRDRIERCLNKRKHLRHVATRFDRRDVYLLSFLHLACTLLWLR